MTASDLAIQLHLAKIKTELAFEGKTTGPKRFWLFIFNILASFCLVVLFGTMFFGVLGLVGAMIAVAGASVFWQVDETWWKVTAWRR